MKYDYFDILFLFFFGCQDNNNELGLVVRRRREASHDGRRRGGEDGGRRPGLGRHQRRHAPRRPHLGPPPPFPSRLRRLPPALPPRPSPAVGVAPLDLAVQCALLPQPLRLRRLLRAPPLLPHLPRRPRHQLHHLRRHRPLRLHPRGGDAPRPRPPRYASHRPRRLDLRFIELVVLCFCSICDRLWMICLIF